MVKVEMECPQHKRYKAKRRPTSTCMKCYYIWSVIDEMEYMGVYVNHG